MQFLGYQIVYEITRDGKTYINSETLYQIKNVEEACKSFRKIFTFSDGCNILAVQPIIFYDLRGELLESEEKNFKEKVAHIFDSTKEFDENLKKYVDGLIELKRERMNEN